MRLLNRWVYVCAAALVVVASLGLAASKGRGEVQESATGQRFISLAEGGQTAKNRWQIRLVAGQDSSGLVQPCVALGHELPSQGVFVFGSARCGLPAVLADTIGTGTNGKKVIALAYAWGASRARFKLRNGRAGRIRDVGFSVIDGTGLELSSFSFAVVTLPSKACVASASILDDEGLRRARLGSEALGCDS